MQQPDNSATKPQTWLIFCLTGYDVRGCNFSKKEASEVIQKWKDGEEGVALSRIHERPGAVLRRNPAAPKPKQDWRYVYDLARAAGLEAGKAISTPTMVVEQHASLVDDKSPIVQRYMVPDGPCGTAHIRITPANCGFAKWLLDNQLGRKCFQGAGVSIYVHDFNQSYMRKDAFAAAFAGVLNKHGIRAVSESMLD